MTNQAINDVPVHCCLSAPPLKGHLRSHYDLLGPIYVFANLF